MAAKHELGRYGERLAVEYLRANGVQVLDRNWRCREGEIDVVAREGRALVVIEVKTRSGRTHGTALEAVDPAKLTRLRFLAGRWLAERRTRAPDGFARDRFASVRIDVIALERFAGTFSIRHERGVM